MTRITPVPAGKADTYTVEQRNTYGVRNMFTTDKFHSILCATVSIATLIAAVLA